MPGGRPPKLFSSKEAEELGKDLLNWVYSDEGKKEIIWEPWYLKFGMFRDDFKNLCKREEFYPYYEIARKIMAKNMQFNKDLHHSYGHRYMHIYDKDVKEAEREQKAFEASLQKPDKSADEEARADLRSFASSVQQLREEHTKAKVNHSDSRPCEEPPQA